MGCRRAAPTLSASTSRSACPSSSGAQVLTVRKHPPRARAAVKRRHALQRTRWRGGRQAHARTGLEALSIQHASCNGTQRANVRNASTEYYALWYSKARSRTGPQADWPTAWACRRGCSRVEARHGLRSTLRAAAARLFPPPPGAPLLSLPDRGPCVTDGCVLPLQGWPSAAHPCPCE
jgi:hypothetical protein